MSSTARERMESTLLSSNTPSNPMRKWCRNAGVLYTIIICCGMYAEVGIRERYINFSSASETAVNIENNAMNFRSAVIVELIMCCSDVGVAILLGAILYRAGASEVTIALSCIFRLVQTSIIASNILHMFAASLILDPSLAVVTSAGTDLEGIDMDQGQGQGQGQNQGQQDGTLAEALALLFLSIQKYGYTLALVFFGLSLFFLGKIIIGNDVDFFPQKLGWACIFAGFGYVLDALMFFLWNGYNGEVSNYFMLPVLVAEFWLAGWLLVTPM